MFGKIIKIIIVVIIILIAIFFSVSGSNNSETEMNLNEILAEEADSQQILDYKKSILKSELIQMDEVVSTEIEILTDEQGEITSVEVVLSVESKISGDMEENIKEYIAESLETLAENVHITYL